jgi:hypothetical protein
VSIATGLQSILGVGSNGASLDGPVFIVERSELSRAGVLRGISKRVGRMPTRPHGLRGHDVADVKFAEAGANDTSVVSDCGELKKAGPALLAWKPSPRDCHQRCDP